ncbi:hypothetical protein BC829DRAFT_418393 [Chytridium lagenaria]|nr:hypothetical protein BC829DRAFT_418393 [Chytridium lagenaria]
MFSSIASSTTTSNAVTRVTAITSPAINTLATIPVITTAKFITGVGSTSQFIPPALATIARPNDLDVSPIPGNALATTSNPSSNFPAAVPENIPMDDQAVSTDVNPSDEPVAQEITSQPSQLNLSICKGKPDFSTLCLGPTKHVTCVGEVVANQLAFAIRMEIARHLQVDQRRKAKGVNCQHMHFVIGDLCLQRWRFSPNYSMKIPSFL